MRNTITPMIIISSMIIWAGCYNRPLKNVTIIDHSAHPAIISGDVAVWMKIGVLLENNKKEMFYIYYTGEKNLPQVNEKYDIYYHSQDISGIIIDHSEEIKNVTVIDKFVPIRLGSRE